MKKLFIALAALMMVGCSTTPKDPLIDATRNYAVRQVKEYYKADVKPNEITITKCDYDFETPYRATAYIGELSRMKAEYINGNIATYDEYLSMVNEIAARFDTLLKVWTFPNEKNAIYSEDNKPLYKCVSPVADNDTVTFYVRWCSPNDTTQLISSMAAKDMIYKLYFNNLDYFH